MQDFKTINKPVLGDTHNVDILGDSDAYHLLVSAPMRSLVLSHNHPSLSYFSSDDIGIFITYPSIRTMEVVTNAGKVWHITKNDNYDDIKVLKEYKKIVEENPDAKTDKIVDIFLKKMYTCIERNR